MFIARAVQKARRFYLDLNPDPRKDLSVVCGGWESCAPHYELRREGFPYLLIEFVAGGRGQLQLGRQPYALERGSVFAYGPGYAHTLKTDPTDRLAKYFVGFAGRKARALMRTHALSPGTCRMAAEPDEVQSAFERVLAEGAHAAHHTAEITALQLRVLIFKMSSAGGPVDQHYHAHQSFVRCRAYLDKHFLTTPTAQAAAKACHVSPAYASRLFASFGHGSFYNYLLRRKMIWAAELLDSGQFLVREVAERLGMDAFHFSRVFKRVHGIAPVGFLRRVEECSREL